MLPVLLRTQSWRAGGRVSGGPDEVVLVAGVEAGQVQFVVDQMVQCMLEAAGEQLPFQINGNEARAGVDGFVAGHVRLQYELHIRHLLFHLVHSKMRLWNYFFYSFVGHLSHGSCAKSLR